MLLTLSAVAVKAAPSFSVRAPHQVAQDNKFEVVYVLKNGEGHFTPPDAPGLQTVYGPGISTSSSIVIVNGQRSSSSSQEFKMIYKASSPGKYTIGPATVVVNGKTLRSNPVSIEVLTASGANRAARQREREEEQRQNGPPVFEDPFTQSADKAVTGKDLFVRVEMSSPKVYEQQAVVCTIKLYTRYQVSQFVTTQQPSFDGFLIEEIPMQPSLNNEEVVDGQRYRVALLKKCLLYPQKPGKLTITSGNYDVSVVQYEQYQTLFGTLQQPVERNLKVQSNNASVTILPLPEPRPASFTGAVGQFSLSITIDPSQLKTFSAATLRCVVSGTGNLKYIKAPELVMPKEFDVYDTKSEVKVNDEGGDMSGQVTFEYPFIPQYVGTFEIPAAEFTYFDPVAGQYKTIPIEAQTLQVAKGEGAPSNHYRMKNMDIRRIVKGDLGLKRKHTFFIDQWSYWLLFLLPLAALLCVLVYYRKRLREMADVRKMRTKRASKVAQKRLKQARVYMSQNQREGFYKETLSSLWGYLSDKLVIPVSELSKDNIAIELEAYGVDEELRQRTLTLLDKCEFAQYAPELATDDLQQVWNEAADLIDSLESVKRKTITQS